MHRIKSVRFVLLIALLLTALTPAYAQDDASVVVYEPGESIRIAVVTDLTGPIAEMGLDIQQAAEIALMEVNEARGIQGFPVECVVEDDRCSGDEGTLVANRIASDEQI